MERRRSRREFDKFPKADLDQDLVMKDVRTMDYMSKFRDYHVRTVFYFALLGMTEEQMAIALDITYPVFNKWKGKHPTFLEAIKKGKEQADAEVVYSLYQAAVGFEHESEQIFMSKEKIFGKDVHGHTCVLKEVPKVVRVPVTKKYPPSVKAAIKWLEIRQPAVWSERASAPAKLAISQTNNFNIQGLSMEELKVLQKIGYQNVVEDAEFMTTAQKELKEINV